MLGHRRDSGGGRGHHRCPHRRRPGRGEEVGLALHRFDLAHTADAHVLVESGAVGKVLVDLSAG
ncbi:hypothetical protein [Cryobacterium mannosilyticum]|uniref:hypothetical protein n=1 Tax=Cryobacterium mannosilyticum TaxID=1259190 RepID=UPI001580B356|nr:hypothetical protein [Cryobacterium mannosilyticum]